MENTVIFHHYETSEKTFLVVGTRSPSLHRRNSVAEKPFSVVVQQRAEGLVVRNNWIMSNRSEWDLGLISMRERPGRLRWRRVQNYTDRQCFANADIATRILASFNAEIDGASAHSTAPLVLEYQFRPLAHGMITVSQELCNILEPPPGTTASLLIQLVLVVPWE